MAVTIRSVEISIRREEPFFNASYIPARPMFAVLDEEKLANAIGMRDGKSASDFLKQLRDHQITFWRTDAF